MKTTRATPADPPRDLYRYSPQDRYPTGCILLDLGVTPDRIYLDHGLTAPAAPGTAWTRPWLPSAPEAPS